MSVLREHNSDHLETFGGELAPGALVKHVNWKDSMGIVVSMDEVVYLDGDEDFPVYRVMVVWTRFPRNPLEGFKLPAIRRPINYSSIAQKLVSVQPMSLPSGALFYLDYKYGALTGSLPSAGSV